MTAWWEAKRGEQLEESLGFADGLRQRQYARKRNRSEAALYLYRSSRRIALNGHDQGYRGEIDEVPPHNNVIASAVDWFVSIFLRNLVRPFYMTVQGDATAREKAKARQQAVDGTMTNLGIWGELGALRCRDGMIFDAGGIKYAADYFNRRVVASRIRPWELFVPEREGRLGFPRQIVHTQLVPRESLLGMYEDGTDEWKAIKKADPENIDYSDAGINDGAEMILVRELWHLPSVRVDFKNPASFGLDDNHNPKPDADPKHDGRRVLAITGALLESEPRPYEYFPVSTFRPFREPVGWWSQGIPEIIGGAHVALLEIADAIDQYLNRHAVPHLLIWDKAKLNNYALSNDHAKIWTTRVPPSQAAMYLQTSAVPAELLNREEKIIAWMKERLGVSNMDLFAEKPAGVEHAPGLEHLSEMTSIRQTAPYKEWERTHTNDARVINDCYEQLAQRDENMEVVFTDSKFLVKRNWREMNLPRDSYVISCQPTNFFAVTPTAKFRQVKEWLQAGFFNGTPQSRQALRLMGGSPDVDALVGEDTALEKNVERVINLAAHGDDDEEWIPEPYMDLELLKQKSRDRINEMQVNGERPDAIDRVIQLYELADELSKRQGPTMGPTTPATGPQAVLPPPMPAPAAAPPGLPA